MTGRLFSLRALSFALLLLAGVPLLATAWVQPQGSLGTIFSSGFENRPPIANAGPDAIAGQNQPTTLAGSGVDPDGDALSFTWRVLSQPTGSAIALSNTAIATPTFTPSELGAYQFELRVSDGQSVSPPDTVTVTAQIQIQPPIANAGPAQTVLRGERVQLSGAGSSDPQNRPLSYAWSLTLQPDGSAIGLSNPNSATPSFTPTVAGLYRVQLIVNNGTLPSAPSTVEVSVVPPPAAQVAPPLPTTTTISTAQASQFLYSGPAPIQTGVAPGAVDTLRGAVIRGRVITRSGEPLPGVTVTVSGRPELGQTLTQADGQFDIAVNGAEQIILEFNRDGLLPVQRRASPDWQGQRGLDRLVMIPPDPDSLRVSLSRNAMGLMAEGSTSSDRDGKRRARLFIPPGSSARALDQASRSVETLDNFTLRITEYTVGDLGPNTMPGELPWTTAYTYAADISFDELINKEATRVQFSEPLPFYVDNFLDFPVGEVVPIGYYDRQRAAWVPSPNGRVLQVLSLANGEAVLDVTGSGQAATPAQLAELGVTTAELQNLALEFAAGESFWRSPIPFLQVRGGRVSTPWDCNWPRVPPAGALPPRQLPVQTANNSTPRAQAGKAAGSDAPGEAGCAASSVIQCQRQVMSKHVEVGGTPYGLHYSTERTAGWRANNSARIPLTGASVPPDATRVELEIQIAGRTLRQSFPTAANQAYTFVWDGLDAYNRALNGAQEARARVGYVYPALNARPGQFQQAFSTLTGVPITGNRAREDITLWQEHRFQIGAPTVTGVFGIGGFSLTPHHFYDPVRRTLFQGDGQIRDSAAQASDLLVRTLGGIATAGSGGDGGLATLASMNNPRGIAVAPDGSVYIADAFNHRIRRIAPDGRISTVAGTGIEGFSGDGSLATSARLSVPADVAVDREGILYIADSHNHRVRRVDRNGVISTVAGSGIEGFAGDGDLALQARLAFPAGVAMGPFGELYIADTFNHRVRKVGADGVIVSTAGEGTPGDAGDGGPAVLARLQFPLDLDVSADGEQFIVDNVNHRIRRVDVGGLISTVAGNGTQGTNSGGNGDGGPATEARLNFPRGVTVLPDGSLLIADGSARRLRWVRSDGVISPFAGGGTQTAEGSAGTAFSFQFPSSSAVLPDGRIVVSDTGRHRVFVAARFLPQFAVGDIVIASPSGDEVYRFASNGRHLETRDAITGAVRHEFNYDTTGRLTALSDGDGNVTRIERDANGQPTAIVSPDGLRTVLTLQDGLLAEIRNSNNEAVRMQYDASGLMTRFADARDSLSEYEYDAQGRLVSALTPSEGSIGLTRSETAGQTVISMSTAEGRTTTYTLNNQSAGGQTRQTRFADNTQTQITVDRDGLHSVLRADGTINSERAAPDPRFPLQSSYTASAQTATGGRTRTSTLSRSVVLANPKDPLSIATMSEQGTLNGRQTSRMYDGATRTWTTTSPAGRTTQTTVDPQGRPLRIEVPGLADVHFDYDVRGRVQESSSGEGAEARTTRYTYSAQGYLQSIQDPIGRTVSYARDAMGRTLSATRPDNQTTLFSYDANGNLASVTPPGRPAHAYTYTPRNLMQDYSPPAVPGSGTSSTRFVYNRDRQLTLVQRPDGREIQYGYDSAGRLNGQTIERGAYSMTYSSSTGQLTNLGSPDGVLLTYTYAGALPTQVEWTGPLSGRIGFAYDSDFRVSAISVNGANSIAHSYDPDGLLITAGGLSLRYDPANGLYAGSTLGNVVDAYSQNAFAEPTSYSATYASAQIFAEAYTRDSLGRITRKVETVGATTRTHDFAYDSIGRLTAVSIDGTISAAYTYDPNGNRLTQTRLGQTISYSYDDQDRLLSADGTSFAYTAAGELRTITQGAASTTLTHDELGNLLSVALPDGRTVSYVIDGQNRRIRKLVDGVASQGFLYQNQLQITAELDGSNAVVSRFVYAEKPHVPAYMIRSGQTYRILTDQVGSVRLVVNTATGAIAQRIDYDEFGNVLVDTAPGFQPFGFAGGLWDRDSGLVRFGARDYDPRYGRWTSKDPMGFGGGDTGLYAYSGSDPINFIDPAGKLPFAVVLVPLGTATLQGAFSALVAMGSGADPLQEFAIGFATGLFTPVGVGAGWRAAKLLVESRRAAAALAVAGGMTSTFVGNVASQAIVKQQVDLGQAGQAALFAGAGVACSLLFPVANAGGIANEIATELTALPVQSIELSLGLYLGHQAPREPTGPRTTMP
jgi:RHS repeat-associated protein